MTTHTKARTEKHSFWRLSARLVYAPSSCALLRPAKPVTPENSTSHALEASPDRCFRMSTRRGLRAVDPDSSCRLAAAAQSGLKVLPLDVCTQNRGRWAISQGDRLRQRGRRLLP